MTVCLTEWRLAQTMKLGWSRNIQEVNQPTFSSWTRQKVLSDILLFMTPWWPLSWVTRMPPFIPAGLGLLVWLFCLFLSLLFCMLLVVFGITSRMVVQDALCVHAGKWPAYVAHNCHPKMHLSKMDGNCFGVPPSFRHQGQNDFSPTLAEMLEGLKVSLVCSPWRLTMAQVIPFSYNDRSIHGIVLEIVWRFSHGHGPQPLIPMGGYLSGWPLLIQSSSSVLTVILFTLKEVWSSLRVISSSVQMIAWLLFHIAWQLTSIHFSWASDQRQPLAMLQEAWTFFKNLFHAVLMATSSVR